MTRSRSKSSRIARPRCAFAFLLPLFALLGACATLPDTLPASGVLGGQHFSVGVDSEEAAYLMEHYLAGARLRPEFDQRIDALYAERGEGGLPDRDALNRIADAFSVDFAAIYFADLINRAPANQLLRRSYEVHLARALKGYAVEEGRTLLPQAADYQLVFVPAYHYESHKNTGADLSDPRLALSDAGLTPQLVRTDEIGSIDTNALVVADYLRRNTAPDSKVIVVSASKSSPEVALALSALEPDYAGRIKAWINIVGTLQGTPLADEVLGDGPLSKYRAFVDDPGMHSMLTKRRRAAFKQIRTDEDLLIVNYIGIPVTGTISDEVRDTYIILRPYGPNDGLNLLADLIAPESVTLADFGRDHYMVDETLRQRTIALVNTTIQWLESCKHRRGGGWPTLASVTDCSLAER